MKLTNDSGGMEMGFYRVQTKGFEKTTIVRANSSYEVFGFFAFEMMQEPIDLEDVLVQEVGIHEQLSVEINGRHLYKTVDEIMRRTIYSKYVPTLIVQNEKICVTYL